MVWTSVASERRGVRGDDGEAEVGKGRGWASKRRRPALERGGNGSNESESLRKPGQGVHDLLFTNVPALTVR